MQSENRALSGICDMYPDTDLENGDILVGMPESWCLSLCIRQGVIHHGTGSPETIPTIKSSSEAGESTAVSGSSKTIFTMKSDIRECLSLTDADDSLACRIYTDAMHQPIRLVMPWKENTCMGSKFGDDCPEHGITVTYRPYHVSLHCDGNLMDEDWPLGDFNKEAAMGVAYNDSAILSVNLSCISDKSEMEPDVIKSFTVSTDNWRPEGHNTGVGDCMPWFHEDRFHLFYLFDRRGHKSKYGLGAHQWAHISTRDLRTWDIHPLAIAIDSQWEGSICTGSVFTDKGIHYAFYAVRMSDGSAAKLSWATSTDGIRFTKTHRYFTLEAPYEPISARDPFVFKDDSGLFHMLVTSSAANDRGEMEGCLAHLVSTDLEEWLQREPYLMDGGREQPECCGLFEMKGWHYLIYSLCGTGRYRMSRSPFGPWMKPEKDMIDNVRYRVPKTASFTGGRRLAVGFVTATPEAYAGRAVFREMVQQPDGTLSVELVTEMMEVTEMMMETHNMKVTNCVKNLPG